MREPEIRGTPYVLQQLWKLIKNMVVIDHTHTEQLFYRDYYTGL